MCIGSLPAEELNEVSCGCNLVELFCYLREGVVAGGGYVVLGFISSFQLHVPQEVSRKTVDRLATK